MDGDEGEVTSGALPASLRDLLRALSCDDERESPRVCLLLWAKKRICSVFVLVCVCASACMQHNLATFSADTSQEHDLCTCCDASLSLVPFHAQDQFSSADKKGVCSLLSASSAW